MSLRAYCNFFLLCYFHFQIHIWIFQGIWGCVTNNLFFVQINTWLWVLVILWTFCHWKINNSFNVMGICSCYKWGFQRLTLMVRLWRVDTNHGKILWRFVEVTKYSKGHRCNSNTHLVAKFYFILQEISIHSNPMHIVWNCKQLLIMERNFLMSSWAN